MWILKYLQTKIVSTDTWNFFYFFYVPMWKTIVKLVLKYWVCKMKISKCMKQWPQKLINSMNFNEFWRIRLKTNQKCET